MKKISESLLLGVRLICAAGALIFALLQILGIWDKANFVAIPMLAGTLIVQTVQEWKENRGVAIFSLVATAFVIGCTVAIVLM